MRKLRFAMRSPASLIWSDPTRTHIPSSAAVLRNRSSATEASSSVALARARSRFGSIICTTSGMVTKSAPLALASRIIATTLATLGPISRPELVCSSASLNRRSMATSGFQHRIELAGLVERVDVVGAADMHAVDEDLRHGAAAVGALAHLPAKVRIHVD